MEIKKIQDANIENKKVLLRVDFNVAVENGKVREKFRIESVQKSLDFLLTNNCKIALMTYFGRPEGKIVPELSVGQIKDEVESILGVKTIFISDCIGDKVKKAMDQLDEKGMLLLENTRFYPGEDKNDEDLAKKMAENFDVFINDAFAQSHRSQSSISGITKFIPSYAGFLIQKEIEELDKIKNNPDHPAVAIIGGAKIETKIPVIKLFERNFDNVLIGGKIANEAMNQNMTFNDNVVMPTDFIDDRMDIGPDTLMKYKEIIKKAKTIVWNGPTGKFEEEKYAVSSNEILKSILESSAFVLIGGGETLEILEKNNALEKIKKRGFVSTGGGAMLEYLGGGKMPGIEVLQK